ncbi:UNVERIFIED_CONTAM: hypothetical protein Sindi_0082600 [Sesamum indicum]
MLKKLCDIIRCDRTSIWVEWLYHGRLRDTSIWSIREHGDSWGWRKILRLRVFLRSMVNYQIRDRRRFYLWQDPWHYLGPLRDTFPRGPRLLGIEESARLSTVISGGEWEWPLITDFERLEITHVLPMIHGGEDGIIWRFEQGHPTAQALYRLFDPIGPKVGWYSLLSGSLKIPRHLFILWLAILGKLATTDKSWEQWRHMDTYSFNTDLVDSVLQQYGEWYDLLGPIETGKQMLTGLPRDGGSVHELYIDYGVSLGLSREKPTNDHIVVLHGNGGDEAADDEGVDDDGFRQETVRRGQVSGQIRDKTANPPLMEVRIEEINGDSDTLLCWHGDKDGKGIIFDGKAVDLGPSSSLSELRFCAAHEDETTPVEAEKLAEEDEATTTVMEVVTVADDSRTNGEGEGVIPIEKDPILDVEDEDLVRHPNLGFDGANLNENHGERLKSSFNMAEFLRLAHKLIDKTDHESTTALEKLRLKWELRFGKVAMLRCFPPAKMMPRTTDFPPARARR